MPTRAVAGDRVTTMTRPHPGITAIIVTRGNVPLDRIAASLPHRWELIVWDNSARTDCGVYGRYAAIEEATHQRIYVQDDDCLIDAEAVAAAYEPGRLVANMPASRWRDYPDSTLVGWGAVFDSWLPGRAFAEFSRSLFASRPNSRTIAEVSTAARRRCDVVFSALTPRTVIDVGFEHLPWAELPDRNFRQPGHKSERDRVLGLCRAIRAVDDDRRVAA